MQHSLVHHHAGIFILEMSSESNISYSEYTKCEPRSSRDVTFTPAERNDMDAGYWLITSEKPRTSIVICSSSVLES
jgi:hypothetical protein